jgi:hypothetical protein
MINTSLVIQHPWGKHHSDLLVNMHIETQNCNTEHFTTAQLDELTTISVARRKRGTISMFYMPSSSWMMSSISRVENSRL